MTPEMIKAIEYTPLAVSVEDIDRVTNNILLQLIAIQTKSSTLLEILLNVQLLQKYAKDLSVEYQCAQNKLVEDDATLRHYNSYKDMCFEMSLDILSRKDYEQRSDKLIAALKSALARVTQDDRFNQVSTFHGLHQLLNEDRDDPNETN